MSDLIARFEDVDMEIIDHSGDRWVTVKQLAEALGYDDHRALVNLINRHPEEFDGKTFVIKLMTNSVGRPDTMIVNYHGVIRVGMLSDAPRAIPFRDWAEEVLFQVMTTGSYALPGVAAGIDGRHWTKRLTGDASIRLQELRIQTREIVTGAPNDPMAWWLMAEMCSDDDPMGQWLRERVKTLIDGDKQPPALQDSKPQAALNDPGPFATRKCRPKLDGDLEVKALLSRLLIENKLSQQDMLAVCRGYYGAERTPGKSALSKLKRILDSEGRMNRFWPTQVGRLK